MYSGDSSAGPASGEAGADPRSGQPGREPGTARDAQLERSLGRTRADGPDTDEVAEIPAPEPAKSRRSGDPPQTRGEDCGKNSYLLLFRRAQGRGPGGAAPRRLRTSRPGSAGSAPESPEAGEGGTSCGTADRRPRASCGHRGGRGGLHAQRPRASCPARPTTSAAWDAGRSARPARDAGASRPPRAPRDRPGGQPAGTSRDHRQPASAPTLAQRESSAKRTETGDPQQPPRAHAGPNHPINTVLRYAY